MAGECLHHSGIDERIKKCEDNDVSIFGRLLDVEKQVWKSAWVSGTVTGIITAIITSGTLIFLERALK